MKFVMSYSCGKDSTLALHRMVELGHEPIALMIMVNQSVDRSYFHGADRSMMQDYSDALNIPLMAVPTSGADYQEAMENALRKAAGMGAEGACFGDIDIEQNRAWSEARCIRTHIQAFFPLWKKNRAENVQDLIGLGYKCLIKSINNRLLPKSLLGRVLDRPTVAEMEQYGIDVCGENGEYHTLTVDGPLFNAPIPYRTGEIIDLDEYSIMDITFPKA